MTSALHPSARIQESRKKIRAPFALDPTLCIYSPQANVDSLQHPMVSAWHDFIQSEWEPEHAAGRRTALLVPCTKYKPYNTSREHRAINGALLRAGWEPDGDWPVPEGLADALDEGEPLELLHIGPLRRGDTVLDRIVMSEPLGLVPYPYIYEWRGEQSPATSYDDPGLFEARGTSVSPERPDSTAVELANGRWRWGPNERAAYVTMHNRMAEIIATTLGRVRDRYAAIIGWVSPGLTHRSFLADSALRQAEGLPASRQGPDGRMALTGALETIPGAVEVMPTQAQLDDARTRLAARLEREGRPTTRKAVGAVYARGDGNDTPLGLPEALDHLIATLERS